MTELTTRLRLLAESIPGVTIRGSQSNKLPNTLALSVSGCDSIVLMAGLDMAGICASSGSACSAGSLEPSHVLLALGVCPAEANSLVRFSLGRESTAAEVAVVEEQLPGIIARIRGGN